MLPSLSKPERVAAASIRGYLYQTVGIALRWLALPANELLLCEGDEDAEHYLVDERGVVQDVTQVQFKDVAGTLSARNEEIQETIFNFLKAYRWHRIAGRTVRFVFTTSARRAQQQISNRATGERHAVVLDVDVLKTWTTLSAQKDRAAGEAQVVAALRSLVAGAKPTPSSDGNLTKAERDYAELEIALAYVDADPKLWTDFLSVVEWQFAQGSATERMAELERVLASEARTRELPARALAQQLIVKVLETSAEGETQLRTLDRSALDVVVTTSAEELEAWVDVTKSNRLAAWMTEVEQRLDRLDTRIDDHDERFRQADGEAREKLKRKSVRNVTYLSTFRSVEMGSALVHIERGVVRAIVASAVQQSLVVVGDPGAGKSGALADVAAELERLGHDVVVLMADAAQAMGDELVDILEAWKGDRPGVLIVDALDSLRDDAQAATLRKTLGDIVRSSQRWRVVATIRTFDLYQGTAVAHLFAGTPPSAFADRRFPMVRHVAIGELSDGEIDQLETPAKRLYDAVTNAPAELKKLLRVPFHLWLAATLLDSGTSTDDIATVRTRVGLLDLYWIHRVANHAASKDAREALLREVCDRMIKRRELHCSKVGLDGLYALLTADVLREPPSPGDVQDDAHVVFSHHVLFDYAVARLWLHRDATALADQLADDAQLLIVVRPSLEMAIQRLWGQDPTRRAFWEGVLAICRHERVRDIGKVIGPGIAAAEAEQWDDVRPLADALHDHEANRQRSADDAFGHLVGALVPKPRSGRAIAGAAAGPWAELADAAATAGRASPKESARRLLRALTERPSELTTTQAAAAGRAARALFVAALAPDRAARWLLVHAICFVCRTQASDPAATAVLIRSVLTDEMLRECGYVLVPRLGQEVLGLLDDPELVEAIYVAAFGWAEDSREETSFGGVVFGLQSNRRQDYEGGLYSLREAFPKFLRSSPITATRTLIAVIEAYAEREHALPPPVEEGSFTFDGREVPVRTDYSVVWDGREHEDELVMADAWENYLVELAPDPTKEHLVQALFETCTEHGRFAIVWCRWLHVAERSAGSAASRVVLPLLRSPHVLWADDTAFRAGECLKKLFAALEPDERGRIEKAILATRTLENRDEARDETCARLLGCIGEHAFVTDEARAAWNDLIARGITIANVPRFSQPRFRRGRDRDTDDWLRVEGAPIDEEPHRTVRSASRALAELRSESTTAWSSLLDGAEALSRLVSDPVSHAVHPRVLDDAWGEVAKALECVSRLEDAASDRPTRDRIARVALLVADCPCPRPSIGLEGKFHDHASWGTPHARGDVGGVLVWLGRLDADDSVLARVEELACDDVPSVRYRVLVDLFDLHLTSLERVWRIADRAVAEERARGVVAVLVGHVLAPLTRLDPKRVARQLGCLLGRIVDGAGASQVRRLAYQIVADLHLEKGERAVAALVLECTQRPGSDDAETLVQRLRPMLVAGSVEPRDDASELQRNRAHNLLALIVGAGAERLKNSRGSAVSDVVLAELRAVAGVLQTAARELLYASGAPDANSEAEAPHAARVAARFFQETAATMAILGETGIPGIVHSTIEALAYLLPHNPARAFRLVASAIASGKAGGYEYDSMAVELMVKTVRRFLADHRVLLQNDERLRDALLDVLDVFVRAGWPEAQELTYGLQDIFR